MKQVTYIKGLHDIGNGNYVYFLPDGSWGWSNAGLITSQGRGLLVDTLFDLALTREMLAAMRQATPAGGAIDILVNTHFNGDHCYGNELVEGARIIASAACAEEMQHETPQMMAAYQKMAPDLGDLGVFFKHSFGSFKFDDITPRLPTKTFEKRLDLKIGKKTVQLLEVGPAHSKGDTIVYVPEDRTLFAADILFIGSTPIMWVGPVKNWIAACELILSMDLDVIVPGHGPLTDKEGVKAVKGYFKYVTAEARRRYDEGMNADEAAVDIKLGPYASWTAPERIVVNVHALYHEFSGDSTPLAAATMFDQMSKYWMKMKND
jgi:glyoxylase-like metal-dependent hydrolase (beta-lactamase superfamily II)